MANVFPDGWRALEVTGAAQREIETLEELANGLSEDFTVYHSVHWTTLKQGRAFYGEIDFVVVNRAGDVLLIEQKCGFLEESPDGLAKRYGDKTKNVCAQVSRTLHAVQGSLGKQLGGQRVRMEHLLYCPDYTIKNQATAGLPPERIVDGRRRANLASIVTNILTPGHASPVAQDVHRFMSDTLCLEADVSALMGQARDMVTRISGGLAHWGRRLEFSPYRLHVVGTAGSGKSQLALAEYTATIAAGKRPLYLCYNRPLADHMQRILPAGGVACTFHALCTLRLRDTDQVPDFSQADVFTRIATLAADLPVDPAWQFDTVIVDEGQDFDAAWRSMIFSLAKQDARLLWLEDPLQNLYDRPAFDEPGWVSIHANTNFRCPRPVVRMLQGLVPDGFRIEAASPFDGTELEVITYTDHQSLQEGIEKALLMCRQEGFKPADIAVISFQGQHKSALGAVSRIGNDTFCKFTGLYDPNGQPQYSDGEVLLETVYRFKGQSAPAIIFAEIDFDTLDEKNTRKLFVGATRTMMTLILVISERSAAILADKLS